MCVQFFFSKWTNSDLVKDVCRNVVLDDRVEIVIKFYSEQMNDENELFARLVISFSR